MPRANRRVNPTLARTLMVLVGALGVIPGCAGENEAKTAVRAANLEFRKLSVGDATLSDELSTRAYEAGESLSSPHAGSDAIYGEAASVTLAMAKLGQAAVAVGAATDAETETVHRARVIRGYLSEWRTLDAVADASEAVDVRADESMIRDLIAQREDDIERSRRIFETRREEIRVLEERIADLKRRASEQRELAAAIELGMTRVSATEGARLVEQVRAHTLEANALELEAQRIEGRVAQLRPEAEEVSLQVEKAREQIALLRDSLRGLRTRLEEARRDAQQARQNAKAAFSRIRELVGALEEFRDEHATPATEKVVSLINDAIRAARGARTNATASGALALAEANQQLARALSRRARGEAQMIQLYESLIAAGIEGDWSTPLETHTAAQDELSQRSRAAFADASDAMRRARIRGDAGEALDAAATRLERMSLDPGASPEETPPQEAAPGAEPGTGADDASAEGDAARTQDAGG